MRKRALWIFGGQSSSSWIILQIVLFSGKVTHSFIVFLNRQGLDLQPLWDATSLQPEYLRDPSSWLPAEDVEAFLEYIDRTYSIEGTPQGSTSLVQEVGHRCYELFSWGVLDSVLKLLHRVEDIYSHPHRFLSYFVSPAPPIGNLRREEKQISFDIPILDQEYPLVTTYLRSALEALPRYINEPAAQVRWQKTQLTINWSDGEPTLLAAEDMQSNLRPEFVDSLVSSLDEAQRLLEQEKKKNFELYTQLTQSAQTEKTSFSREQLEAIESELLRMRDYFARSSQLVTLLVGQGRADRQVREAMKRVDWESVMQQFPHSFFEAIQMVRTMKENTKSSAPVIRFSRSHEENLRLPL